MVHAIKNYATGLWVDRHLAQWVTVIMIVGNASFAGAIIFGGPIRFTPPSYEPLLDYVNGKTWIWGVWIGAAAALMSVPFRRANIIGLWLSMVWHIIWMTSFMIAINRFENAAATPVPAYAVLAMISTALLTARVIENPRE